MNFSAVTAQIIKLLIKDVMAHQPAQNVCSHVHPDARPLESRGCGRLPAALCSVSLPDTLFSSWGGSFVTRNESESLPASTSQICFLMLRLLMNGLTGSELLRMQQLKGLNSTQDSGNRSKNTHIKLKTFCTGKETAV